MATFTVVSTMNVNADTAEEAAVLAHTLMSRYTTLSVVGDAAQVTKVLVQGQSDKAPYTQSTVVNSFQVGP